MRNLIFFLSFISAVALTSTLFFNTNKPTKPIKKTLQSDCALEKEICEITLPDGHALSFNLEPKGFPAMETLHINIAGLSAQNKPIKLWFEGKDMSMGVHFMLPAPSQDHLSKFSVFKGMIPVCTIDNDMIWLLKAEIPNGDQLFQIQFQLQSVLND